MVCYILLLVAAQVFYNRSAQRRDGIVIVLIAQVKSGLSDGIDLLVGKTSMAARRGSGQPGGRAAWPLRS
jgi:hypothetical protein